MNPIERASKLRQEADLVLQGVGVYDILRPYGSIVPTGSYFLDVMVYPDIDLYIPQRTIQEIFTVGGQLAQSDRVPEVSFARSDDASMPEGLYLKPRIRYGEWGRPWKIDIWSIDADLIELKMEPMLRFKQRMTPWLREQIIRYKLSILTPAHRTPMYSGFFIYKAFIEEGITEFDQVSQYLVKNGIQMG